MKKSQLIILSDISGKQNDEWISIYLELLEAHFEVSYLDSKELAEIDESAESKEEIHAQFVSGGIEKAVSNLLNVPSKKPTILAFSIGGTIAWKAALKGLQIKKLIAVSSTRLRKEYQKPKIEMELFFGSEDENAPDEDWFDELVITPTVLDRKSHEMYKDESFSEFICEEIISAR